MIPHGPTLGITWEAECRLVDRVADAICHRLPGHPVREKELYQFGGKPQHFIDHLKGLITAATQQGRHDVVAHIVRRLDEVQAATQLTREKLQ